MVEDRLTDRAASEVEKRGSYLHAIVLSGLHARLYEVGTPRDNAEMLALRNSAALD